MEQQHENYGWQLTKILDVQLDNPYFSTCLDNKHYYGV